MSGGEPFLFPDFVTLTSGLTRKHFISINTNLSSPDIPAFGRAVDARRVVKIAAALHVTERERLGHSIDDFVHNVALLTEHGFPIAVLYILYPPLLTRARQDIERLERMGVTDIQAKVFKGRYEGRRYPEAYSDHDASLILSLSGKYPYNAGYMRGPLSFKGRLCSAGCSSFKIFVNGDVRRCASVPTSYGNLYDGSFNPSSVLAPCTANRILVLSQCLAYLIPERETDGAT